MKEIIESSFGEVLQLPNRMGFFVANKIEMSQEKQGYISLHRKVMQNFLFKEKRTFSKFEAWIYLLMSANHTDAKVLLGNQLIDVKKGSFITSEVKLMAEFSWSKSKLRAFLSLLESQSMIEKVTDSKKTTLTIVKYSDYQELKTAEKPQKNRGKTAKEPQSDTNNNGNNYNNENNENNHTNPTEVELVLSKEDLLKKREQQFDWFWETYGKKVGKDIAKPKFMKLKNEDVVKILDHVPKYVASKPDRQFRKDPTTYINQKTWNDEIITETFTKPQNPQNGTPKQQPHAFIRKTLRNLERLGTFNSRQVEIAEYYLEHATGPINSEEFFGKLEQLDWSSPAFYPENIGDTLRLGERQDNRPAFELDN